ncbi:carboxypeptidase Y-deficient [Geranomyces variabilis]|uniref:Carboxypeptidase Y-deficient n=1 Tax=Geranomyces variabilis TaxID=109894 RepID=A0AAD5THN1_9FUNG|nr:carboxypeptidase Y-deficient [Geranomyces variabilis]
MNKGKGPAQAVGTKPSPRMERLPKDPSDSPPHGEVSTIVDGLACPICGDAMLNLGQLNRHLDDAHQSEFDTKDALASWFRAAQRKVGAAAAPLSRAATGTISSLRVDAIIAGGAGFELNPGATPTNAGTPTTGAAGSPASSATTAEASEASVTRAHWVVEGSNDRCAHSECGKPLGLRSGRHHCRKCGRMFCDTHSAYQMRLAPATARADPVAGVWCRVCRDCYTAREGYNSTLGVSRSKTRVFVRLRKSRIDALHLESNKLEKRLEKLTALYKDELAAPQTGSPLLSGGAAAKSRRLEQSVVAWEDDSKVLECPLCSKQFGTLTNRRHHCRLCGRVVCGTGACSIQVALLEDDPRKTGPQIRVCTDCKRVVTRRADKRQDTTLATPVVHAYRSLVKYRSQVDEMLPKFNALLMSMANRAVVKYEDNDYQVASKYRKSLMEWFSELDKLGKRIKLQQAATGSSKPTSTTVRLLSALHLAIITYLQTHMFTLQLMPKVSTAAAGSKPLPPTPATRDPAQLAVLKDQRALVQGFLDDALRRRRFEDAAALQESLDELDREIEIAEGG